MAEAKSMLVVAGLAMRDGLVLLGKRKKGGRRGELWEMPGGKVEDGEPRIVALQREWKEELGLDIAIGERIACCTLDVEVKFDIELYEVTFSSDLTPVTLDHDELTWVKLDHAIGFMPCSPAMYMHYPQVREWFAKRELLASKEF